MQVSIVCIFITSIQSILFCVYFIHLVFIFPYAIEAASLILYDESFLYSLVLFASISTTITFAYIIALLIISSSFCDSHFGSSSSSIKMTSPSLSFRSSAASSSSYGIRAGFRHRN